MPRHVIRKNLLKTINLYLLWLLLLFSLPLSAHVNLPAPCVQIYYDRPHTSNGFNEYGQIYAIFLQNLLGHFPEIKDIHLIPIEMYQSNQLNSCKTNFYIGYFNNLKIPNTYLHDFITTSNTVVWINANILQLRQNNLKNLWDVRFSGMAKLDWGHPDSLGQPGFYRDYEYKGETFPLLASSIDYKNKPNFGDTVLMQPLSSKGVNYITAWIKHNSLPLKTPYILHNHNHWYVASMPFAYIEKGNYLIFCDTLFDILDAKPRYAGKRPALIRIEDVNAGYTNPQYITELTDLFSRLKIPFSIALIPIFKDPLNYLKKKNPQEMSMAFFDNHELYKSLLYAKKQGASFIWHGTTHQYKNIKNPFNAMSGADFEFWNAEAKKPIKEDSVPYILNNLQQGADILAKTPIKPVAWMPPHYLASPLDYVIFGQVFLWYVGRVDYMPGCKLSQQALPRSLTFDRSWPGNTNARLNFLGNLTVTCVENHLPEEQYFPYEIFNDYYGQRIIPENLGNLQPYLNEQVVELRSINDIIQAAKRNRVIRDAWASFFIHPSMLNSKSSGGISKYSGDTKWLENLVTQIQSLGYEFIDLNKWTKDVQHS